MTIESVHQRVAGLLIVAGSLVFLYGGASQPLINSSIGPLGSQEFFNNFYMHIAHHTSWEFIHGLILAGPVLWLLGVASYWRNTSRWSATAITAMTLAAALWAVTFVFDGFVAPSIVRMFTLETGHNILAANQNAVIRLGLISWLMLALAMISGSLGKLASAPSRSAKVISWIGIVIGLWPFLAWATGDFLPGPFTSRYWTATAIVTAAWFIAVGIVVIFSREGNGLVTSTGPAASR